MVDAITGVLHSQPTGRSVFELNGCLNRIFTWSLSDMKYFLSRRCCGTLQH